MDEQYFAVYHDLKKSIYACRETGWFYNLAIVNSTAINMGVQKYLLCGDFDISQYIPTSGKVGSCDTSIFSFMRNLHSVFWSRHTNSYCHQQ
jgi:hypothetical protein